MRKGHLVYVFFLTKETKVIREVKKNIFLVANVLSVSNKNIPFVLQQEKFSLLCMQ
jgi:hypothetical protein